MAHLFLLRCTIQINVPFACEHIKICRNINSKRELDMKKMAAPEQPEDRVLFWIPFEKWMTYCCNPKTANRCVSRIMEEERRILTILIIWHLMLMILFRLASHSSFAHFYAFDKLQLISEWWIPFALFFQASSIVGKLLGHLSYKCTLNILSVKTSLFSNTKEIIRRIVWICDGDKRILHKQFESELVLLSHCKWKQGNLVSIHIFANTRKCFVLLYVRFWTQLIACEGQQ